MKYLVSCIVYNMLRIGTRARFTIHDSRYSRIAAAQRGITTILVVGFMGIFMIILGTVTSYAFQQAKYGRALFAREQALHVAEAGLEYYRWLIAHDTYDDGTMMTTGADLGTLPSSYTVTDPEGDTIGTASLDATAAMQCGAVQWLDVTAEGSALSGVGFPRTVAARYMRRSVAEYAFIWDSTVWFGSTNIGSGPYHANSGMRMDGTTNSDVTASVTQLTCGSSLGCSPSRTEDGVFGDSATTDLWQYPVSTIDFPSMALNFSDLQTYAQTSGIMLNPTSVTRAGVTQGSTFASVGGVDNKGFHLIFNSDGTVTIYRVTATNGNTIKSYNSIKGNYTYDYPVIASETLVASNISLPSDCAIIYSQAKTWIEGTVQGKVTLIAADPGSYVPNIVLNNDIVYASTDGTTGLTAVAKGSIQLGLIVPDNMYIRGIFVAQTGQYGRDYYLTASGYLPASYYQYSVRTSLTVNGTIVSYQRGAVSWGSSGFSNRYNYYDRVLAFSPPPFTPAVTSDYSYVLWREE